MKPDIALHLDGIGDPAGVEDFLSEARTFLDATVALKAPKAEFVWGAGSDSVATIEDVSPEQERRDLEQAQKFMFARASAGFGWITGPVELGGRALPVEYERAYHVLESQYSVPNLSAFAIGLNMIAPTLHAHGSDTVKSRYLERMHRGEVLACQLFSEPGAGSDLAGVQTRAERDGNCWVLTGQKVWTSAAHLSQIGEAIARTDPTVPKHRGLTAFVVDMQAPGVEIRPLRQMTGGAFFNEVFLNEVRVPDDHRLGEVGEGWRVALTTLMNERSSVSRDETGADHLERVIELVRHLGLGDHPVVRQRLAELYTHHRVRDYTDLRTASSIRAGQQPGPEMSIGKLATAMNTNRLADFVTEVLGPRLVADTGDWGMYAWSQLILNSPGIHLAGGTDEIMRNILGERVLGLPKDPLIDTSSPFQDMKVGTQRG